VPAGRPNPGGSRPASAHFDRQESLADPLISLEISRERGRGALTSLDVNDIHLM
jgi:hypothetical protein